MLAFELSLHAIEQMESRNISQEVVFEVLNNPDHIEIEIEGQLVYQKIVKFEEEKPYLVRVFVNTNKTPNLVKTVYRTSKFLKYNESKI
jgi:hypothetical protein